jgi:hypothetical protein
MEALECYNNTLCVRGAWLIEEGVITTPNYKQLALRGHLRTLRRGGNGRLALIEYSSIPERFKAAIIEKLGYDPAAKGVASVESEFVKHIRTDAAAEAFYLAYEKPCGGRLNAAQVATYCANAQVLRAAGEAANERAALRRMSGNSGRGKTGVWATVAATVNELDRTKYPHTLPGCERRLRDLWRRFTAEGYGVLVHGQHGNRNAAKVDDETKESLLTELLGSGRNLDNEQVARLYNVTAERLGWAAVSASAVGVWRERLNLTTYAGRRGGREFSNKMTMQAKRSRPSYPLYFWSVDGWDVELLYQRKDEKTGATTFHNRPTVVVVVDACADYPVGYAVGTHETPELIRAALRDAANHVAELFGRRYRCLQAQSDRYSIKKLSPMYNTVAEKFTPAAVGNAKAKPVERKFLTYNKYCQLFFDNWSGFGITSKKDLQPNTEWLNANRSKFPDYEGCKMQISKVIEATRKEKIDRYMELWASMPEADRHTMDEEAYLLHFGEHNYDRRGEASKNSLQPDGLTLTICGEERVYDSYNIDFRRHSSVRWTVLYDPADLTRALAVNDDRSLRFMLESKYIQPMALRERSEGDAAELKRGAILTTL